MGDSTGQYKITGHWVRSRQITNSDTGTTVAIIDVPAGTLIPPHGIMISIETLFAGGTPSIDIGDGDDPDGWIDTTAITEATAGPYADVDAALAVTGKYYASADTIDAVVSASLTAGEAYVFCYMIPVADVYD
jgi:hypothetical protein